MGRNRQHRPGDIWPDEWGEFVRMGEYGEVEPFEPEPYDPEAEWDREPVPDPLDHIPRRADGSISPFYTLGHDELERLGQDTPRNAQSRRDGWTPERQKDFIETLAATGSVADACRYAGLSRQSAYKLYQRSPPFRAAWDEAMKFAVRVLADTAFDRAVNGTQEQVYYQGRMVGFREKHHDRLLMYLLRVRDPLNFAPLDDLAGWQRFRAIEDRSGGIAPVLDRLEAADRALAAAQGETPRLTAPADLLEAPDAPDAPETPSTVSTSSTSPAPAMTGGRKSGDRKAVLRPSSGRRAAATKSLTAKTNPAPLPPPRVVRVHPEQE